MKPTLFIGMILFMLPIGCATQKQQSIQSPEQSLGSPLPEQSLAEIEYESDAKYIPEADSWIDYSNDPLSYHYHGRSRYMTPQEREVFEAAVLVYVDPDNDQYQEKLAALKKEYKCHLAEQARLDSIRFKADVNEIIAAKRAETLNNIENASTKQRNGETAGGKK